MTIVQYCCPYSLYCVLYIYSLFSTHCKFVPLNIYPIFHPSSLHNNHFTLFLQVLLFLIPQMNDAIQFLSSSIWLVSLSMACSRFIHIVPNSRWMNKEDVPCGAGVNTCNAEDAGDRGSILGSGRSPGGGNDKPL